MSHANLRQLSETEGPRDIYDKYLEHLKSFMGMNVVSFKGGFIMINRDDGEVWQGALGLVIKLKSSQISEYTISIIELESINQLFPSFFMPVSKLIK